MILYLHIQLQFINLVNSINDTPNNNNPLAHIILIAESKYIFLNLIQIPLIKCGTL